jgi:hypothetical protein
MSNLINGNKFHHGAILFTFSKFQKLCFIGIGDFPLNPQENTVLW